jgi:hypothetical protein
MKRLTLAVVGLSLGDCATQSAAPHHAARVTIFELLRPERKAQ